MAQLWIKDRDNKDTSIDHLSITWQAKDSRCLNSAASLLLLLRRRRAAPVWPFSLFLSRGREISLGLSRARDG